MPGKQVIFEHFECFCGKYTCRNIISIHILHNLPVTCIYRSWPNLLKNTIGGNNSVSSPMPFRQTCESQVRQNSIAYAVLSDL